MTHPVIAALRQQLKATPVTGIDLEPEVMRERFNAMTALIPPHPGVSFEQAELGGVDGRWIAVEGAEAKRTILYFHGGAYVIGSAGTHRDLVSRIASAAEARVFSANYRLAPEHPYPAALDDALAAFRALVAAGTEPGSIVIAGDSAGGGLALCAALALRDAGGPTPGAVAAISPWVDLASEGESFAKADDPVVIQAELHRFAKFYVGGGDIRDPLISPIHASLSGIAPTLVHVGGEEGLRSDCEAFAAAAKAQGAPIEVEVWDGMIHAWHSYAAILPEGAQAIDKLAAFIAQHT